MVNGVNESSSTYNASQAKGKSTLGKDDFMKLMISQLKYQDPLNPMEGTEFSAQLAQFSSLEQLSNMSDALDKSIEANYMLTQSVNNTMTAALIGKEAKLSGGAISFTGQEDVNLGYTLPSEAKDITINIYDTNGKLVKTFENEENSSGDHKLSWDFTDNNGKKLPNGNYTFEVKAKSLSGEDITANIYKWGLISSVKFTEQGTKLLVGSTEYSLSDVLEILGTEGPGD